MTKRNFLPLLLMGLVLSIAATSCGPKQQIFLSKNKVIFAPVGGLRSVKVYSDCSWTIEKTDNQDWFTVSPMEGQNGDIISIRAGEWNEATDRSATITVVSENGKVRKELTINQRRIDMTDLVNKFWFMHFYERWETDYYDQYIEDSYRSWHYLAYPEYDNWFFYFLPDSTGYQWHAKNNDTVYFAFNYIYYPLEDSLYINFETDSAGIVEDYHTIVEELDGETFIFQNEYRQHRFERLTMDNVTAGQKHPFVKPKKVSKKPAGPIIQVAN